MSDLVGNPEDWFSQNEAQIMSFPPGLAEVIGGLGLADLQKLMGTVIQTAERQDIPAHVRDGYIMMYIFLPVVFKEDFKQYIGPILPSILQVGFL